MDPAMILCRLDEIALPGSKGFSLGQGAARREIFVVRGGDGVWAYENSCPHTGGMLDWVPDQFLIPPTRRALRRSAQHFKQSATLLLRKRTRPSVA